MKTFSLNRNERVKKKKDFEKVYSSAKIIFSSDHIIKSLYIIDPENLFCGVKIATAVSKLSGNAVWRNRVKRLIKESYRLNKCKLIEKTKEKNIGLLVIFSPYGLSEDKKKKIYLSDICPGVIELIEKIKRQI